MENETKEVRATIIRGYGMWQHPIAVEKAMCPDGIRRKVRLNQDGETGRCNIKGKTVKGFMTVGGTSEDVDYNFYPFRKVEAPVQHPDWDKAYDEFMSSELR